MVVGERSPLFVIGNPPARLRAAFNAVQQLHHAYDNHPRAIKGASREHCIFSAQASALAFRHLGFDARTASCVLMCSDLTEDSPPKVAATRRVGSLDGKPSPGMRADGWNGHMVTIVDGFLFDPTFWQIDKSALMPVMLALPFNRQPLQHLTTLSRCEGVLASRRRSIMWIDAPESSSTIKPFRHSEIKSDVVSQLAARVGLLEHPVDPHHARRNVSG